MHTLSCIVRLCAVSIIYQDMKESLQFFLFIGTLDKKTNFKHKPNLVFLSFAEFEEPRPTEVDLIHTTHDMIEDKINGSPYQIVVPVKPVCQDIVSHIHQKQHPHNHDFSHLPVYLVHKCVAEIWSREFTCAVELL